MSLCMNKSVQLKFQKEKKMYVKNCFKKKENKSQKHGKFSRYECQQQSPISMKNHTNPRR